MTRTNRRTSPLGDILAAVFFTLCLAALIVLGCAVTWLVTP